MSNFDDLDFIENCKLDGGLRKKGKFKFSENNNPLISIITPVLNNKMFQCLENI